MRPDSDVLFIQSTQEPVFKVSPKINNKLCCKNCNDSVLIDGYREELFIDISIQCYRCGNITVTPDLSCGVMLPHRVVVCESGAKYKITSVTIDTQSAGGPGVCISSSRAKQIAENIFAPRANKNANLPINLNDLDAVIDAYDFLVFGEYKKQKRILENSLRNNNMVLAKTQTFAWSIFQVKKTINAGLVNFGLAEFRIAVGNIFAFCHVYQMWHHHPEFGTIMRTLSDGASFNHTMMQMITAIRLYDVGTLVGLNSAKKQSGRSSDLFLRFTTEETLHIEVKAPKLFEALSASNCSIDGLLACVEKTLKKSKGQITSKLRGILVICAKSTDDNAEKNLSDAVKNVLRLKGNKYTGVSAIILVTDNIPKIHMDHGSENPLKITNSYNFEAFINEHFLGPNPIYTDSSGGPVLTEFHAL